MNEVPDELRNKLCVALDVDDRVEAVRLAKALSPWFGAAKVGLELFSAAGTDAIGCLLYTSPSPRDRQKSRMPSSA